MYTVVRVDGAIRWRNYSSAHSASQIAQLEDSRHPFSCRGSCLA